MIFLHGGAAWTAGTAKKAAYGNGALRHGIDTAIGTDQRSLEEDAALKAFGITKRSDCHINAGTGFQKCSDVSRDHDGSGVLRFNLVRRKSEPVTLKGIADGAQRCDGIAVAIARKANDETVANELVVAPAFDLREVLDASGLSRNTEEANGEDQEENDFT
jgi:hypothetical protein